MVDDGALLEAWMAEDRTSGQSLVRRHYDTIYTFFHARLDPDTSADLTQSTFETLCQKGSGYKGASTVRAFMLGIARWKLVAHYRLARHHRVAPTPFDEDFVPTPSTRSLSSLWARRETGAALVEALRTLSLDAQILLELKDCQGFTARELADVFAVPQGTIATRIRKARADLGESLLEIQRTRGLAQNTSTDLTEHLHGVREAWRRSQAS